jgi:hypothetical protein
MPISTLGKRQDRSYLAKQSMLGGGKFLAIVMPWEEVTVGIEGHGYGRMA